jgi:hypothetical protein
MSCCASGNRQVEASLGLNPRCCLNDRNALIGGLLGSLSKRPPNTPDQYFESAANEEYIALRGLDLLIICVAAI